MFPWRRDRKSKTDSSAAHSSGVEPRAKASGRKPSEKHGAESYGFTGLEGDFEAERRRAAEAAHEPAEPYEGEGGRPSLPGTSSGLTHP